jgi:hypothetical protein
MLAGNSDVAAPCNAGKSSDRLAENGYPIARGQSDNQVSWEVNGKTQCRGNLERRAQVMSKRNWLAIGFGGWLLLLGSVAGSAYAQKVGQTWMLHSDPKGACPGVDWDVTRVGNTVRGVIGWDSMQHLATLEGTMVGNNGNFTLNVKEVVGGDRTGTITGQVRKDGWLVVKLQGTGTGCDGQAVNIPIWRAMGS